MKKDIYIILLACFLISMLSCKDGYIDDINAVDPGPDSAAPDVTISSPAGNVTIPFTETETDVEFKFSAADDIELQSIAISLDGSEKETYNNFVDYRGSSESFKAEDLAIGEHTFVVTATDLTGKVTEETLVFEVTNQYVAKDGEIFYMPFEGESYLELISEVEGTTNGNTGFEAGIVGDALSLEAASQSYMLFPNDAIVDVESFTLSFWVNAEFVDEDDDGGIDGVLGLVNLSNTGNFWGNIDFFLENGSNPTDGADMRIHITNDDSETWITSVNDVSGFFGAWSNHVLTYNAAAAEFNYYINGALEATVEASWDDTFAFQNSGPMVFGCVQFQTDPSLTSATAAQGWASYLTGRLDEVRIFNKALSDSEVQALYDEVN